MSTTDRRPTGAMQACTVGIGCIEHLSEQIGNTSGISAPPVIALDNLRDSAPDNKVRIVL